MDPHERIIFLFPFFVHGVFQKPFSSANMTFSQSIDMIDGWVTRLQPLPVFPYDNCESQSFCICKQIPIPFEAGVGSATCSENEVILIG